MLVHQVFQRGEASGAVLSAAGCSKTRRGSRAPDAFLPAPGAGIETGTPARGAYVRVLPGVFSRT